MNLSSLLLKLGLSSAWVQDITLLLVVIFLSFIFGIFIGRNKLIAVLINIYISLALVGGLPEKYFTDYVSRLAVFFAVALGLTLISKKIFEIHISGLGPGYLWRVFAMSFLEVGMITSIVLKIMPKKIALEYVSSSSFQYLASPNAHFFWILAPLVLVLFIHKK